MGFLLEIVIVLVVVGLVLWILQQIPIDPAFQRIIRVVIIVLLCLWLIYFLVGLLPSGVMPPLPRR
jgi:hypothetical protein